MAKIKKYERMIKRKEPKIEELRNTSDFFLWLRNKRKMELFRYSIFRDLLAYDVANSFANPEFSSYFPQDKITKNKVFRSVRLSIPLSGCERFLNSRYVKKWKIIFDITEKGIAIFGFGSVFKTKIIRHYLKEFKIKSNNLKEINAPYFLREDRIK